MIINLEYHSVDGRLKSILIALTRVPCAGESIYLGPLESDVRSGCPHAVKVVRVEHNAYNIADSQTHGRLEARIVVEGADRP